MKYTIYIVDNKSDAEWIENNFGYNAGDACRSAEHDYGYGNFGIRVYDGKFCGYGRLSFYLHDSIYGDSEFIDVKDAISSALENDCQFECDMSDLMEA